MSDSKVIEDAVMDLQGLEQVLVLLSSSEYFKNTKDGSVYHCLKNSVKQIREKLESAL